MIISLVRNKKYIIQKIQAAEEIKYIRYPFPSCLKTLYQRKQQQKYNNSRRDWEEIEIQMRKYYYITAKN